MIASTIARRSKFPKRSTRFAAAALRIATAFVFACAAAAVTPTLHSQPQATASSSAAPAHSSSAAARKKTSSKKRRKSARREPSQKAPTPDRISEIQSALARNGYYQSNPNGKWDSSSVAAMQKFQSDNGLDATGKLDALSLQKLGLGSQIAGVFAPQPPAPRPAASPKPDPAAPRPSTPPASTPQMQ
jgi:peptidoglycan hydrolase-like protein with peptidoglycan-binding domain